MSVDLPDPPAAPKKAPVLTWQRDAALRVPTDDGVVTVVKGDPWPSGASFDAFTFNPGDWS